MAKSLIILFSLVLLTTDVLNAQSTDALIRQGNRYYNKQKYDESLANYEKALKKSPENADAHFNQGDALYRKNDFEKAASSYDDVLQSKGSEELRQKAYYNKGVAMVKQKKIEESIDAWKNALRLDPSDADTRDNLVRALLEKKKQDEQKKKEEDKKDQKDKKDKKDDKPKQDENQKENKPKNKSKLTKQQVEQYLKSLEQKEKDVQDKMNQNKNHSLTQPDKDW